jgi:predicted RNA binding protein YcfA (HicA-like mRNA interferase family)/predicted RNase H-like HicB family nuclease
VKYREFIRLIEQDGWIWARTTGSHRHYHHPEKPGVVTVAGIGNVDIPQGTLNAMLKQAGLKKQMKYTVIYEKSADGYGAYVPDLPGLGVVAPTLEETRRLILEGIPAHIHALREHGEPVPEPTSSAEEIDIPALA